jgi:NADH-quinone oxidoreductase subunit H
MRTRGKVPRIRIDQLMGFAWKWLLPAALLNLFITATAIVVVKSL